MVRVPNCDQASWRFRVEVLEVITAPSELYRFCSTTCHVGPSSAHQEVVLGGHHRPLPDNSHQELLTVRQYSKAIRYLQPHFSDHSRISVCVTLIVCIVFVTLEFLRGNYTIGMKHLQHGLNLLQEFDRLVGLGLASSVRSIVCFDDQNVTLFTRILVQAKLLG